MASAGWKDRATVSQASVHSSSPALSSELAAGQWHLDRLGKIDQVWTEYSGKGVKVAVYDSGVEYNHWDLDGNYDASRHLTIDGKTYDGGYRPSSGARGTSLAGLIAAENNGMGTVGVAFDARITGVNIFDPYSGEGLDPGIFIDAPGRDLFIKSLGQRTQFDVVLDGFGRSAPDYASESSRGVAGTVAARIADHFATAAAEGRGGLGTISLNGAGGTGLDAQADSAFTSRHTITVAAYREDGYATTIGGRGASLLVSAPSGDTAASGAPGLVTTDLLGRFGNNLRTDPGGDRDITDTIRGTVAAAASVTGVHHIATSRLPPAGRIAAHRIVRAVKPLAQQQIVDARDAQLLAPRPRLVFFEQRVQSRLERPQLGQRLNLAPVAHVRLRRPDRLAHYFARQMQVSHDRLDGFPRRVFAPDPQHRLQYQHPDLAA